MDITLLGPQRRTTAARAAVAELIPDGPVATINAGWRDREADTAELDEVLGGRMLNLRLYDRWQQLMAEDDDYAAEERRLTELLAEQQQVYAVRLQHAMAAVEDVGRRTKVAAVRRAALDDAVRAVRDLDGWHLRAVAATRQAFYTRTGIGQRESVARHRSEIEELVATAGGLLVAGGHVGVLLHVLHIFGLARLIRTPLIAWSAGAMALAERVVLFHAQGPPGRRHPELYAEGLAAFGGVLPFPHPRRRLQVDDADRMSVLAARLAPRTCVLLADGVRHDLREHGPLPPGVRRVDDAGAVVVTGDEPTAADRLMAKSRLPKLAINTLRESAPDDDAIQRFLERHEFPIVEGTRCTFVAWVHADAVYVRHRVVGLASDLAMRRIENTDVWYAVVEIPADSRVEYQFELRRDEQWERFNDPHNPRVARSPVGDSSVCYGHGYQVPDWAVDDPDARPGELLELMVRSQAQRRDNRVTLYLPARFRSAGQYPLLVVHDGGDFLEYASMKVVLDNLIHRMDMAEAVVAFTYPGERLTEYPNNSAHARWITRELVPQLEEQFPLVAHASGRALMGSSFGAVAALQHRGPTPRHVRVAAAAVRLVRVHRHRREPSGGARRSTRW